MIRLGLSLILICLLLATGCSRNHYRLRADRETYTTLGQKTANSPWALPAWFTITPDPESRYATFTNPNDPELPVAATKLYAYRLPELPERDPSRYQGGAGAMLYPLHERGSQMLATRPEPRRAPNAPARDAEIRAASHQQAEELPLGDPRGPMGNGPTANADDKLLSSPYATLADDQLIVVPIPKEVWQSLPPRCLDRMLEFDSVRQEYTRSFERPPQATELDDSEKLALEDIIDVALINSREYQRQKELLYVASLNLTLERFAYDLKFDPFGQGTDANYTHDRTAGITTRNELATPTNLSGGKLLATGGNLVASFANRFVLSFNGSAGVSSEMGSELAFALSQSIFQRDFQLESLTQSERDVVYAARNFARFRKLFFRDLANDYYDLLLTYRGIEIESQGYFSNLRAFNQGQAEFAAGSLPRVQVDQFEQDALRSRSNLIGRCNTLESNLDNLKFTMGIPPELPLNLDLTELELLTLRDEATVSAELVRRARRNLNQQRQSSAPDRVSLLNYAIDLTRRMRNLQDLRGRLGVLEADRRQLDFVLGEFLVDEARILVEQNTEILANERAAMPPTPPLRIFQRTTDLIDSQLVLVRKYRDLAALHGMPDSPDPLSQRSFALAERLSELQTDLLDAIEKRQLQRIPQLVTQADALLREATALVNEAAPDQLNLDPKRDLERIVARVEQLLAVSEQAISQRTGGLTPIEISVDDAMLTALAQRFDVMNQRGRLADDWRQIKLRGDDLKSVLNLQASQSIRTDSTANNAFDFTLDDNTTQLSMSFDAPLNRKAQRNNFRVALINYQLGLRSLIALEDSIKLTVRNDLRNLQLDREQYDIAVASAALAYERKISTQLQLQLGVENVAARDFLEAQQAYTESLSAVAGEHIGYVKDRIALFIDLELLQVDDSGFWPGLYDESLQVEVNVAPPSADGPYGQLPARVWHTKKMRRMLQVPYGAPISFDPEAAAEPELLETPKE